MYEYKGTMVRWVDGDTCDILIDLGFRIQQEMRLRLFGIDTPERGDDGFHEATDFAAAIIPAGTTMLVRTYQDRADKYGRYLAFLWPGEPTDSPILTKSVNEQLLESGHAVRYPKEPG